MQPQVPAVIGGFLFVSYIACVFGVVIYIFRLLGRYVGTQKRIANALERVARKVGDEAK